MDRASQLAPLVLKNLPANAGDVRDAGSIPGSGRSPGRGHGNPLQYSCLKNPMDRGAWRATAHSVAQNRTRLSDLAAAAAAAAWLIVGEGPGNLLHYSCLKNPMDRGAWRATVHSIAKSRTRQKQFSMHGPLCHKTVLSRMKQTGE